MAATLCKWIFVKPCEAIGDCCEGMFKCCADMCACCTPCWEMVATFCDRPFAATLTLVFLGVFAPAAALMALAGMASGSCDTGQAGTWALVFGAVCLVTFGVAVYVFCRFNEPYDLGNPKDSSYTRRLGRLLCEDPVIALYICVLIFKFVWLCLGGGMANTVGADCDDGFKTMLTVMQIFGWVFFGLGGAFVFCQLCYVTVCPDHANKSAAAALERQQRAGRGRGGSRQAQQPRQQNPTHYQAAHTSVPVTVPVAHAQPVYAQPAYNQQQAPQVVVHAPARTAGATGAGKQQAEPTAGQQAAAAATMAAGAAATGAKALFGAAKGMFGGGGGGKTNNSKRTSR